MRWRRSRARRAQGRRAGAARTQDRSRRPHAAFRRAARARAPGSTQAARRASRAATSTARVEGSRAPCPRSCRRRSIVGERSERPRIEPVQPHVAESGEDVRLRARSVCAIVVALYAPRDFVRMVPSRMPSRSAVAASWTVVRGDWVSAPLRTATTASARHDFAAANVGNVRRSFLPLRASKTLASHEAPRLRMPVVIRGRERR